uniref:Uncharacterized protein n=1 Tax=Anguilla anguilla TaxID=7936 RepID=A0A0E9P7F8_ANGAN
MGNAGAPEEVNEAGYA